MDLEERNAREKALAQLARTYGAKLIVPKRRSYGLLYTLKFDIASYQGTLEQCEIHMRAVGEQIDTRARVIAALLQPVLETMCGPENGSDGHNALDDLPSDCCARVDFLLESIRTAIIDELRPSEAALKVSGHWNRSVCANEIIPLTA